MGFCVLGRVCWVCGGFAGYGGNLVGFGCGLGFGVWTILGFVVVIWFSGLREWTSWVWFVGFECCGLGLWYSILVSWLIALVGRWFNAMSGCLDDLWVGCVWVLMPVGGRCWNYLVVQFGVGWYNIRFCGV